MFVIEHPIPYAPVADSEANVLAEWNAVYDAHNEVASIMLEKGLRGVRKAETRAPLFVRGQWCSVASGSYWKVFTGLWNFSSKKWVLIFLSAIPSKRVKHNLDFTYLWHFRLAHISKKRIGKLNMMSFLKSTDNESFDQCVSCLSGKMTRKSFPRRHERATDLLGLIHTNDYALESARILNMVPTKKVDKTPYELWYGKVPNLSYLKETMGYYFYFSPENKIVVPRYVEFLKKNLLYMEVSGRAGKLKEIQDEDTWPSEITSEITIEVEGFKPPHEEEALVCRSVRTHEAPERLCLDVEVEEHSLGDLNEPANYKAAMLDPESNKWLVVYDAEMNP
ncbi:retrotransposon protein, putative, ty1-copia subclass [Tanacetum coccineum]